MIALCNAGCRIPFAGIVVALGVIAGISRDARAQALEGAVPTQSPLPCRSTSNSTGLNRLTSLALQADATVSDPAIQALRRRGPESIAFLMRQPELRKWPRWSTVLDSVAQQKDAEFSGLFWHTDLSEALAVAKRERKPVLSLRLLGKLTDELSCANSRFFRTTLYPNAAVRSLLATHFVLHWQSVRAVPIITIDFGDGRQLRRTITGNSLHLVLDDQGRAIDILPGLYTAEAFVSELQQSGDAAVKLAKLTGEEFLRQRAVFHDQRVKDTQRKWVDFCRIARFPAPLPIGIDHEPEVWTKVAQLSTTHPVLDAPAAQAVLKRCQPLAVLASRKALSKALTESPALVLIRNVSQILNEDSVRNEYDLHVRIHTWFAPNHAAPNPEALVSRVYSELFLSPLDDPWFGLSRPDVYSAIKNDGRIHTVAQTSDH